MAQGRDVLADALLILGDEEGVGLDPEAGGFPLGVHRVGHDSWISRGSNRRLSSGISLVFSSHLDLSDVERLLVQEGGEQMEVPSLRRAPLSVLPSRARGWLGSDLVQL